MQLLAVTLSVLGTVCISVSSLLKGKNMRLILLLVFLCNALIATSYFLTGAFNGAVSCSVGAAMSIINYFFEKKNKPIPMWLIAVYAVAFVAVNLLVFTQLADVLALLGALTLVVGLCQKSGRKYRFWSLVNTVLWITYDIITLSFGPLSTHAILLVTILAGMVMHDRKKKTE